MSLASLIGIFTFGRKNERLEKILIYGVAFSAGALMGDVFFHLLPELAEESDAISRKMIGILVIG